MKCIILLLNLTMKIKEFEEAMKSKAKGTKSMSYFYAILFTAAGLFILFGIHVTEIPNEYQERNGREYPFDLVYLFGVFLISLGSRGFYTTSKYHKIEKIRSEHSEAQKVEILDHLISDLNLTENDLYEYKNRENEFREFKYTSRLRTPYLVYITQNQNFFLLSVGVLGNGLLVFDGSRRAAKRIKHRLQCYVDSY